MKKFSALALSAVLLMGAGCAGAQSSSVPSSTNDGALRVDLSTKPIIFGADSEDTLYDGDTFLDRVDSIAEKKVENVEPVNQEEPSSESAVPKKEIENITAPAPDPSEQQLCDQTTVSSLTFLGSWYSEFVSSSMSYSQIQEFGGYGSKKMRAYGVLKNNSPQCVASRVKATLLFKDENGEVVQAEPIELTREDGTTMYITQNDTEAFSNFVKPFDVLLEKTIVGHDLRSSITASLRIDGADWNPELPALYELLKFKSPQEEQPTSEPVYVPPPTKSCCKVCSTGKACGNSCISRSYTCHKAPGCACDG